MSREEYIFTTELFYRVVDYGLEVGHNGGKETDKGREEFENWLQDFNKENEGDDIPFYVVQPLISIVQELILTYLKVKREGPGTPVNIPDKELNTLVRLMLAVSKKLSVLLVVMFMQALINRLAQKNCDIVICYTLLQHL